MSGTRWLIIPGPLLLLVAFLAVVLVPGCADLSIQVGRKPDLTALEQRLQIGESSPEDVLKVLGEPQGKGRSQLPIARATGPVWSYYYEESSLNDSRRTMLYVYFLDGRYQGYMWFSSLPQ